jgi:hypothetical protein
LIYSEEIVGTQNPAFVYIDVERRNKLYEDLWSADQKNRAVKMKNIIYEIYTCRPRVFLNYRQNFIAIKVAAPTTAEINAAQVEQFSSMVRSPNKVKKVDGGVVYEFRCI